MIILDGIRTPLPYDLDAGSDAKIVAKIQTPEIPGKYILELDMVQEGVAWFGQRNNRTYRKEIIIKGVLEPVAKLSI
jgi:hypothetical protein